MLSTMTLGSGEGQRQMCVPVLCVLGPASLCPLCYSLRAECVVIWACPHGGSVPGERALVPWQQTQGPLFERSILLPCVNGRKAGCHTVPY